ncbi:replication region DNA-binding N-term [Azotobacter beijerinckii]|uniref:Replication region DNA-binding N-term n=1 Tax=Azotobacter beijerinckii TaxID=170623 RepID=A0A1H6WDQ8_9GAMM|nr:DNA-binding protein [Azotobacter beijerinckii]SEJ15098.1 replication region DNA-binding N-term [Azotobacter beijerinckii]
MSTAIPADVRDRVLQAAQELYEQNGRESMPTVDAVRRHARVDMNAASVVMREWRRAQRAQSAPLAVTVPEAVTQAHSTALVVLWQTAQQLANESLRAAQAAWETERSEAERDRQEMADAYERQAREREEAQTQLETADRAHQEAAQQAAQTLAEVRAALAEALTRAERAEARALEIEHRAEDLRAELDRAHQDHARAHTETASLAGELRQSQEAVAALRAQRDMTEAGKTQEVERLAQAARLERDQLLGELVAARAATAKAQEDTAEARERAAGLAGKLESEQAHGAALAALLARLEISVGKVSGDGEHS